MNHARSSCIDIHTHVVPENFPAYVGRSIDIAWPSMSPAHDCHRHVMLSGKVYRTVPDTCWNTDRRIEEMTPERVERQVLSPMPELLSYWLPPEDGRTLARYLNEQIAQMVSRAPRRFSGLATVPLQDVEMAISELEFAVKTLGLSGAEIGTNVNGVPLGDPRLAAFFHAADAFGAALFIHPLRPAGLDRLVGPAHLEQIVAFPGETGLAAASLLTGDLLNRNPGLRIALSHGGGTLSSLLPRLQHGWETFAELRDVMPEAPTVGARRMYYDSLVYDRDSLLHLIGSFGATQICVGSDFPFKISEKHPVGRIEALDVDDATSALLLSGNAKRWLALS
jgi:aminocarboxymuconate-semialdehyde decarboxylase